MKGVYHLNMVDEVTQWQVVGAVSQISEAWLKPALEAALEQFPFQIKGFHSDNGSEFINYQVAGMLERLFIEQTKSRPRHSNAGAIQTFYREHLNPYLNFHRPCGQAEIRTDAKGKQQRVYRRYETPWDVLRQLPDAASYLCPGRTMEALQRTSLRETDTESATRMQVAKGTLFRGFYREARSA